MALEELLNKIKSDAVQQAESIKKEALAERERILERAKIDAAKRKESILSDANEEAELQSHRIITMATLDSRRETLTVKQGFIEECFKRTLDEISNLDSSSYQKLIKKLILAHIEKDVTQQILILSQSDLRRLNPKELVKDVNQTLEKNGINVSIQLAPEFGGFKGGFLLQWGKKSKNLSWDMLFRIKRPEWELQIARILFS